MNKYLEKIANTEELREHLRRIQAPLDDKGLAYFIVVHKPGTTEGASIYNGRGVNGAATNARNAHMKWEGTNGIDTEHDWRHEKKAETKPVAIIVKGNPKYIDKNVELADKLYGDIQQRLEAKGYTVKMDPGLPYTRPILKSDVWIGHSRGVDRLQYAPKRITTFEVKTKAWGGDDPLHYELTDEDIENINKLPG